MLDLQPSSDQQVRDRRRSRGAAAGLTIALANADRSAAISLSLENLFVFRPGSARAFGGVCCVSSKSKCRCHKNQLLWPLWPSSNVFAAHCYPPYQCKPIAVQQGGSRRGKPARAAPPAADSVPVLVGRRPERVVHGLTGGRLVALVEVARADEMSLLLVKQRTPQLDQLPKIC